MLSVRIDLIALISSCESYIYHFSIVNCHEVFWEYYSINPLWVSMPVGKGPVNCIPKGPCVHVVWGVQKGFLTGGGDHHPVANTVVQHCKRCSFLPPQSGSLQDLACYIVCKCPQRLLLGISPASVHHIQYWMVKLSVDSMNILPTARAMMPSAHSLYTVGKTCPQLVSTALLAK